MSSDDQRDDTNENYWTKCGRCGEIIYNGELNRNFRLCPKCNYCFPMDPADRIATLIDEGSLVSHSADDQSADEESWIIVGEATLSGHGLIVAAVNFGFADQSTSLFVCQGIIRAVNQAVDRCLPLLLVCTDSNGDRAFFPALSISAAISRLAREKLLYISVLACPGPFSSFPGFTCVADIVIAESSVVVVARSGNQTGQNSTQAAETLFQNGMADMIVPRKELQHTLTDILNFFC